jgi:hypothetical protein
MRRLTLALLGLALLSTAAAALAAEPAAAGLSTPGSVAVPDATSPALINLLPENSTSAITPLCPPTPVTTCNSCFYFGTITSYQCTTFCVNGVFHRSCTFCGSGCPL